FSVQKKIWLEVGGKVDYETEKKLGYRVGWRKNSNWIDYDDLTFSLQAPVGHLPRIGRMSMFINDQRWASLFLSRVKNCQVTSQPTPQPTPQLDIELKSAKGVNYNQLEQLLKAGKLKEADRETANKMLEVAGRTHEGWLDTNSINNFPSEDLRTINQLWVKYSMSHFGFSVQKKIWLEVGGKVDYETEKKLGDRVGWRKNGSWMNYDHLTFSLQAPVGHLPRVGVVGGLSRGWWGGRSWGGLFGRFSRRIKNCQLTSQPTPQLDIELKSAKGVNYDQLEQLLKAGKWKEADRETANKMLEVTGRTHEGWLDTNSINNFPSEDLRTIDQLWVKYSMSHFGFSVQKKIWLEVGGKVDYETEKKLG
ncbi:GUN4 domain-containing protein, partial [Planktothrix tepida]|uniref:GUN4 domain-containing protein n=1 Tax=Planktothrix tepida TaxID=1678309 RepID=UPI000B0177CA